MRKPRTPAGRPLVRAIAVGLCTALLPMAAQALSVSTDEVAFSGSASVTDAEGGTATTNNGASLGSTAVTQFDSSLGVLTGATLNLESSRQQTVSTTSTDGANTGPNTTATTTGSGTSTVGLSAPGVTMTSSSSSASDSCTANRRGACSDGATTASVALNQVVAVSASALDSYVGGGSVSISQTAPTLSATQGAGQFTGTESTAYMLTWAGTLSATYDYLLHAAPSFDTSGSVLSLDLDFGTVYEGDDAMLQFSLANLAGDRVGLDLDSISGSGDTDQFSTDLALFMALLAGDNFSYTASLDTSLAGAFSASLVLGLSDADVGAESSRFAYMLTINLHGTVLERDTLEAISVPEPAGLALLGAGLLVLAAVRRRRA